VCGIVGILNFSSAAPVDREVLFRMTRVLAHRGPDDEGFFFDGPIGLGHRRLSVIDLSCGHQPMVDEERGRAVVFNGEIYNFREIRKRLASHGCRFTSDSDTEVLLQLADASGHAWLSELNGMFAFAVWQKQSRQLLLVRDRLGIKPLYYAIAGGCFLFSSEIKALLLFPGFQKRVNEKAIPEYLAFRSIVGPETLFRDVYEVPAGHFLTMGPGLSQPKVESYWDEFTPAHPGNLSAGELAPSEQFQLLFNDAVRYRLISDVPVGTYNSGGVDSTLVTSAVREQATGELHTFSVGFEEESYDESRYAQTVADMLGTKHHVVTLNGSEYADTLEETIWHNDQPLNHPHTVQLLKLSRVAKEYVTVVLTGEGADELFAGYPRYQIPLLVERLSSLPTILHRGCYHLFETLRIRRLVKLFEISSSLSKSIIEGSRFCPSQDLTIADVGDYVSANRQKVYELTQSHDLSLLEKILYFDRRTYLPSLLHRLDRATMASGVEARVPFLDYRLVHWSTGIPQRWKIGAGFENKVLLKALAAGRFDRRMVYRSKAGFGVPIASWFRDTKGLGRYLDLITEHSCSARLYLSPQGIQKLVREHLTSSADHSDILWGLVNMELWMRRFIDSDPYPNFMGHT
jgi:asparagine synthase (glutamine-hydrolysing)